MSGDPDVIRAKFKVEYEALPQHVDLVQMINSYTTPEASHFVKIAKDVGFIMHESGPALHRRGQVPGVVADADLEMRRLCAKKALLQEELRQHQLDLSKVIDKAVLFDRTRLQRLSCKRAREARAMGAVGRCVNGRCIVCVCVHCM